MRLLIDLENRDEVSLKNIETNWNIQFPSKKKTLFNKILDVFRHVEKSVYVGIRDIDVDGNIKCVKDKLFYIQFGTRLFGLKALPLKIDLSQENTPFQLFVDTNEILDCNECQTKNRKKYHIKAILFVENAKHKTISEQSIDLEVEFLELDISPSIKILFNDKLLKADEIQYDSDLGNEKIGKLRISYKNRFHYAPYIDVITSLQLYQDDVLLDNVLNVNRISRKNIKNNDEEIPLFIDFTKLKNPSKPSEFKIVNNSRYNLSCNPEVSIPFIDSNDGLFDEYKSFMLLPDPHGTELQVNHDFNGETVIDLDGETTILPRSEFRTHSPLGSRLNLVFNNLATDKSNPNAGILLKHLVVSSEIQNAELLSAKGNLLSAKDIIRVEGGNYKMITGPSGCFIPNGKNSNSLIVIDFLPSLIDCVNKSQSYEFQIVSTISFDYWENRNGINHNHFEEYKKSFQHTYVWNLFQRPNKEWLCVDYGTSAIVCMYDNKVVDLKAVKDKLFSKDSKYKSLYEKDEFEVNSKFLSSDILLHDCSGNDDKVSSLCTEQSSLTEYSKLAVCLSPTSSLLNTFGRNQIPCLKLLIGHEFLPQAEAYHDLNIPYFRMDDCGKISKIMADDAFKNEEKNSILKIDNVFKEAYNTLLRYYVKPSIENVERVNKLVITYPNTYTPVHINMLKSIVSEVFPSIRPGYLKFVGESDAVAAFYMKHWAEYHEKGADMFCNENVLVYDMGAGTLDLTLFTKRYDGKTGVFNVEFLSKIGTTKAGNYLDSLIARILVKSKLFGDKLIRLSRTVKDEDFDDILALKNSVRKNKMLLDGNLSKKLSFYIKQNEPKQISESKIVQDEIFTKYLKQVTEDIIDNLLRSCCVEDDFKINTIIMSGRACKLRPLQEKLQTLVKNQSHFRNANVIVLDEPVNGRVNNECSILKSAVCEGAITCCNLFGDKKSKVKIYSKRLYANYGITFKSLGGRRHYVQLIGVGEIPLSDTTDTKLFKPYSVSGLAGADGILLIQSYMTESKTLKVLEQLDETDSIINVDGYDYISEMMKVEKEDYNNADTIEVRLELDSDNNISLLINGNPTIRNKPKGINLESEITKMSLWPVPIC